MERYVLTVNLNAAVDVAYVVPGFAAGRINIAAEVAKVAGGKANNVARVLARLGDRVIATGFAGGGAGRFIQEELERSGVTADYEPVAGESRTCMAIADPDGGTISELREKGPTLGAQDQARFLRRFDRLVAGAELVVMSGSLPPGIAPGFYGELISHARSRGIRTILDSSGPPFREGLAARPFLVKPNREELGEWAGAPLETEQAVLKASRRLLASGPERVAVSLGAAGMLLVTPDEAWLAVPPPVVAANPVGSGDSAVAGLAMGLIRGDSPEELLRLAVACGTANALTRGVAEVNPDDVARLRAAVRVEQL